MFTGVVSLLTFDKFMTKFAYFSIKFKLLASPYKIIITFQPYYLKKHLMFSENGYTQEG